MRYFFFPQGLSLPSPLSDALIFNPFQLFPCDAIAFLDCFRFPPRSFSTPSEALGSSPSPFFMSQQTLQFSDTRAQLTVDLSSAIALQDFGTIFAGLLRPRTRMVAFIPDPATERSPFLLSFRTVWKRWSKELLNLNNAAFRSGFHLAPFFPQFTFEESHPFPSF